MSEECKRPEMTREDALDVIELMKFFVPGFVVKCEGGREVTRRGLYDCGDSQGVS